MARLSRRFSRYFSLSRRSAQAPSSPKISKSQISHPIPSGGPEDTHGLLLSSPTLHPHAHAHAHSSSQYTISDAELRQLENEKLSRRLEDDIDDILAQYASVPSSSLSSSPSSSYVPHSTAGASSFAPPTDPFADPKVHVGAAHPSSSPTPSSNYSSPPSSPPTISAKLERFRDTPPPAPGWEKVSFGRQTRLFGPEGFVDLGGGGSRSRPGKDWRGEFGRRGYAVL